MYAPITSRDIQSAGALLRHKLIYFTTPKGIYVKGSSGALCERSDAWTKGALKNCRNDVDIPIFLKQTSVSELSVPPGVEWYNRTPGYDSTLSIVRYP